VKPAILLVDDDLFLLALTAELLSGLGYRVTTACNGSEALAVLDDGHAVDMLVTDVQMPGLHGLELARRAKAIRPTLAILYCTGNPELIVDDMGPTLGPVLSKPLRVERLDREITRVHQAQAPSPDAVP
jgi:CheY-like chemotaxis protein